jgi:polyhydroxyalkanoate synthase
MRRGPRPLSVHIAMAASSWQAGQTDEQTFSDNMQKMLLGIRQYQTHPELPKRPPTKIFWRDGEVVIRAPVKMPHDKDAPIMLLVPSMINRAHILDLLPGRSMLRWMNAQGIRAYLLDWGEPVKDNGMKDINSVINKKMIPAIKFLAQHHAQSLHILGYCMGGTMAAGAAVIAPQFIKSTTFLASPWDFHAGSNALLNRIQFWAPSAAPMIETRGYLPVDWIQTVFASLDPLSTAQKFAQFSDMDGRSNDAKIFVAVEDWLNDGVDLPADIAREPILEWFIKNKPAKGQWKIGAKAIKAAHIKCLALIVTSKKDRLVEYDMAAALAREIKGAKIIDTGCGHIGMMAGKNAIEKVWKPIAKWIKAGQGV